MPSELKDSHTSSLLSEEVQLPNERQIGFWKTDGMPDNYGVKDGSRVGDTSLASLPLERQNPHTLKRFDVPNLYLNQDHIAQRPFHNKGNRPNLDINNKLNVMGDHYENGLFSSSLSELFTRKLRLSANNNNMLYGHSVGAAASQSQSQSQSHYEEEEAEPFESLEEIEAQTIGNLLPDDDDDLLSGVTDGLDCCKVQPDDAEELDLFSSVGGMELGEDNRNYEISATQLHRHAEHPSRTLFVRNINSNVEDSELRILFEQYGDVRTLYTACKHRGFVMISYYDIRASRRAMQALQNKPLRRRKLDIHYSIPKENPSDKDTNHGAVVIYNLDSNVTNDELGRIFGVYGEVKEIREGSRHKSIDFYDIRAAEAALRELTKSDMQMKLEPIGASKRPFPELDVDEASALLQMCSPPSDFPRDISISGMAQSNVGGSRSLLGSSQVLDVESANSLHNHLKYNYHPHSLPDNTMAAATLNGRMPERVGNRQHFNRRSSLELNDNNVFGQASGSPATHHYMWNPSHQPHNMMWPNSPSLMNGVGNAHRNNTFLHINNHNHNHNHLVGSAPSVNPSIWDRRHSFAAGESPDTSSFHPASLGPHPLDFVSHHNIFPRPIPSKNIGLVSHHQNTVMFPTRGHMIPIISFDSPRTRRNENQPDNKKQFELDLDRIMRGDDRRTTLMIKNIPNKYTSKMLLAAIDERHRGTYDFIYLPIDFKNKCNVGYAFINMTEPSLIVPFYQAFNGKKWEKFNSEKVASLAYARIQGKAALIAHFQNSSLMNEDKRCRPILFHTDGPNAGDQVPFPMGVNVRSRVSKNLNSTNEESSQDVGNGEASSNGGDSSSGSTKDFD